MLEFGVSRACEESSQKLAHFSPFLLMLSFASSNSISASALDGRCGGTGAAPELGSAATHIPGRRSVAA